MKTRSDLLFTACALILSAAAPSLTSAATIVGGSDLLNATSAAQLQSWLGKGDVQLTNIYDKKSGDTATQMLGAITGKGATFVVLEVTAFDDGYGNVTTLGKPVEIGGYNPTSWLTAGGTVFNSGGQSAFVFNLSSSLLFPELSLADANTMYSGNNGDTRYIIQTQNGAAGSSTTLSFGANSINIDSTLGRGVSSTDAYSNYMYAGTTLSAGAGLDVAFYPHRQAYGDTRYLRYGQIEVFSVAPQTLTNPIPEPQTYALMLAGLVALGLRSRHGGSWRNTTA